MYVNELLRWTCTSITNSQGIKTPSYEMDDNDTDVFDIPQFHLRLRVDDDGILCTPLDEDMITIDKDMIKMKYDDSETDVLMFSVFRCRIAGKLKHDFNLTLSRNR